MPETRVNPFRFSGVGPGLLMGGAGILFSRTITMLAGRARVVRRGWVVTLTVVEMAVDVVTMLAAARWWVSRAPRDARFALRSGAASTLLHATRVLVFVLARIGPWVDFDVKPEHRAEHRQHRTSTGVTFAGVMSSVGIAGMVTIWRIRRSSVHEHRQR